MKTKIMKKRGVVIKVLHITSLLMLVANMSFAGVFFVESETAQAVPADLSITCGEVVIDGNTWTFNGDWSALNFPGNYDQYDVALFSPSGTLLDELSSDTPDTFVIENETNCNPSGKCSNMDGVWTNQEDFTVPPTEVYAMLYHGEVTGNESSGDAFCQFDIKICTDNDKDGYFAEGGCNTDIDCDDDNYDVNSAVSEICDGIDNNCNGAIDEFLVENTSCGTGLCSGNTGQAECVLGVWVNDTCNPLEGASDEDCDGSKQDEDCDGNIDEGCDCLSDQDPLECGYNNIGECQTGFQYCNDGTWGDCIRAISPVEETCDGLDNDCDGDTDEDYATLGDVCSAGLGECEVSGVYECTAAFDGVACSVVANTDNASDELCDGKDNDCDGETDENFENLGTSCTVGAGECANTGNYICTADGSDTECDVAPYDGKDEICDGKDNDCDGETDEGDVCGSDCVPSEEVCDKIDNNCNDFIDEDGVCDSVCEADTVVFSEDFESPAVDPSGWEIFTEGLNWMVDWLFTVPTDVPASLELHNGVGGWTAHDGQYAELDGDWYGPSVGNSGTEQASVRIYKEDIVSISGVSYELSFWFSPRPEQGIADNKIEAYIDGVKEYEYEEAGASDTNWTKHSVQFTADDGLTTIEFRDGATESDSNSLGVFLDEVTLKITDCHENGTISIYKYNDLNGDGGRDDGEPYLPGWDVFISGDSYQYEGPDTITDSEGKFVFSNLPFGEYMICEIMQDGWANTEPGLEPFDWSNNGDGPMVVCEDVVLDEENSEIDYYFGNNTTVCIPDETILDAVAPDSLPSWTVHNTGGNPIFSYGEIVSPFDSSTAIRTSVVGSGYQECPSQMLEKSYVVSGNSLTSDLKAYLAFTSTGEYFNFAYLHVQLLDGSDNVIGYQIYYGDDVISGIYAGHAAADPDHYTELPVAAGDVTLDLSVMGDVDFSKIRIYISNYACIGENSVTFDHLRLATECGGEPSDTIKVCKNWDTNYNNELDDGDEPVSNWAFELLQCVPGDTLVREFAGIEALIALPIWECGSSATRNVQYTASEGDDLGCAYFTVNDGEAYRITEMIDENAQSGWEPVLPSAGYMTINSDDYALPDEYQFLNMQTCGDGRCDGEVENCENCAADCGECGDDCVAEYTYTVNADFDKGTLSGVEYTTVANQLQLTEGVVTTYPVMWIANAGDDTVSKWDTNTNKEIARYATWFGAPNNHGAWSGAAPSRTAVDTDGNCYIANRHFDGLPADVLKILSDDWIDRNGNGVLDTSVDLNSDGVIDPSEMLPLVDTNSNSIIDDNEIQDERIAWVKSVGANGAYGRSLAIDLNGNLWLGLYNTSQYYKLSSLDGTILDGPFNVGPNTPYGALVDKDGILWGASLGANLLRLDTNTNAITSFNHSFSNYGLALGYDSEGYTQVYLGSGNPYSQFDSKTNTFSNPVGAGFSSLGLAVDSAGNILAGNSGTGGVTKYTPAGVLIWDGIAQVNSEARGVVVDSNDDVWVIHVSADKLSKFSGVDGSPLGVFDSGLHPYTYSDATGLGLRGSIAAGNWTVINDSTVDSMVWQGISWNSTVPEGATMTVKVRSSNNSSTWSSWLVVNSGDSLASVPNGRYLEVQVSMQSATGGQSPILYDLTLERDCGGDEANVCGDGVCGEGEQCCSDCGGCSNGSDDPVCGNGEVESGETCDDNNRLGGDGCDSSCHMEGSTPILTNRTGNSSGTYIPPTVLGEEGAPILSILKNIKPDSANPNQKGIEVELTVKNSGNLTAFDVIVTDVMPWVLIYQEGDGVVTEMQGADNDDTSKVWNIGDIAPGGSKIIAFKVDVDKNAKAGGYTGSADAIASNHTSVNSTDSIAIDEIVVLSETGFSLSEFIVLITFASVFGGLSLYLRRKMA